MTLLGELYAEGLGIPRDDKKAADWYKLAAARGDTRGDLRARDVQDRGPCRPCRPRRRRAQLLDRAAKLGHVAAAYNLALLYLEGQQVQQNLPRAAELLRIAADAGSPEAQYALATFYKEGNGVAKDPAAAAKLLAAATRGGNTAAEVEYAIALFNGTGVAKDESAASGYFLKAAQKGNAGGPEPPRADVRLRPWHQGRPGPSGALAPDRARRRRQRPVPG